MATIAGALLQNGRYCFCSAAATSAFSFSRHSSKCAASAPYLLIDPREILLVEFLRREAEILLDRLRRGLQLRIGMNHVEQFALAPLLLDEVADAAGLKIGDNHLRRIIGIDKAAIELVDRQQLLIADGDEDIRRGRFLHSGECSPSSCTARPSVNQRGTR